MNRQLRGNLPPNEKANGKNRFLSLLLLFMAFVSVQVYAQDVKVSGTINDSMGPIIGANVIEKGTTNGVITDVDGKFTLTVSSKDAVIQISYIGFTSQEFKVGNQTVFNIKLSEDTQKLDEVVVVGYGSQRKSDLTGGIVAVGEEKLQMVTTNNLMDKLAGQIPGMNVTTGNAKPGEDQSLRVRGENSLSADNSPLIVMDGIPYSGSLGDIDPDIIENMSVLKDASSTAIYGSRGANGVILIQTKKGKKGAPTVSYKGQVGMQQAQRRIDMMKGAEYVKYTQDYNRMKYGYSGDQLDPLVLLNPSERANYQNGSELDWQDIMFRNALTTSHQISISGGTDATTYMASISHLKEDGVMENTGLKRTNIALNITQVLNKWLTVGMGTQAVQKEFGGEQPYLEAGLKMSPYGIYKDEEGRYVDYPMDQTLFYNPMANINATNDKTNRNVFISTFAEIQFPIEGLSFRTNFGYNYRNEFEGTYYGRNTLSGSKVNGSASIENIHYYDYTWENLLKYNKTFGLHKIDATALFSMQETSKKEAKESGESFVNDDSEYHNMAGAEKNKEITSKLTETAMLSYMLRLNYSYANKYLLTLTGRSDGYSAFGKNNKYAFFPSVAAAWNMSSEEFMENQSNWMDMLKVRLSWGSNGNQAINPYQTLDRLKLTNYIWGDHGTVVNGSYLPTDGVGNPNLKWEETTTWNAGFDFGFLDNRITSSLDNYYRETKDLINVIDVPAGTNFKNRIVSNIGSLRNQGVEFSINAKAISTPDWKWDLGFNVAWNNNEITKLTSQDDASSIVLTGTVEGGTGTMIQAQGVNHPANSFYVYEQVYDQQGNPIEGLYVDRNGDGVINDEDRYFCHKPAADVTMGFTSKLVWKAWDFSFSLRSNLGNYVYNNVASSNAALSEGSINNKGYLSNRPLSAFDTNFQNMNVLSDYYVQNASFLRCDNITLGYSFNKLFGVLGGRIYGTVQNPFVITKYKGLDPEVANAADKTFGIDKNVYPRPLVGILGVSLNF